MRLLIDVPRNRAIFDLWFDEPPRFFELDQYGRRPHSFQHYLRALSLGDFTRRSRTGEKKPPLRPMLLVRGGIWFASVRIAFARTGRM